MKFFSIVFFSLFYLGAFATTDYSVDTAQSNIEWVGTKKIGESHNGTVRVKNGTLTMQDGKPVKGVFTVDMTTIKNLDVANPKFNKKLVDHLESVDFFDVKSYGESVFSFDKIKDLGNGQFALTGKMKIRGVEKEETIQASFQSAEQGYIKAESNMEIDRTRYGITYHADTSKKDWFFTRWMKGGKDKIINNNLNIKVNLVAIKK